MRQGLFVRLGLLAWAASCARADSVVRLHRNHTVVSETDGGAAGVLRAFPEHHEHMRIHHAHHNHDHRNHHEHGPARSSGKYACMHDDLMSLGLHRNHSLEAEQDYGHGGNARRLQDADEFKSMRFHLDTTRLVSGKDTDGSGTKYTCFSTSEEYQDSIATGTASSKYPCKEEDLITPERRKLIEEELMPMALDWLSKTLSVRPVQGALKLSSTIPSSSCYFGNDRYGFTCCDDQTLPEHKSPGVSSADYVVHVTARPFRGSVVAWAYPCTYDQYSRPTSGQINFVPSSLSSDPAEARMQFIKTLHELVHNLGFSSDFFPKYRKPGSLTSAIGYSGSTQRVSSSKLQKTITTFIMANAVEKTKEHFDCQNWPTNWGLELEDDGGSGTAGKHVEERLFYNELMSGWVHENTVPSAISLAVLEDSGWYKVSYALAEKLYWGKGEGCSFAQDRCSEWDRRYFCSVPGQSGCTPDMKSKALCNAYQVSPSAPVFESQFQYFEDDPRKAGKFEGADFCPIFEPIKSGDCTDPLTTKYWYYGEYTGTGGKCFMGTFQLERATSPLQRHGGCAHAECDPLTNRIRVTLSKGQPKQVQVLCPAAGGDVDLATINSDWKGTIECPRSSVLCSGDPCDVQDCNGHGICQNADGSCICDTHWFGDDAFRCDKKACPANPTTGVQCSGHGTCDFSTGTCTGQDGLPGCFPGYKGSDCGTLGCPDGLSPDCSDPNTPCECSGRGACVAGSCNCTAGYISSDCGLTDCPSAASNGLRCGGSSQGTCDVTTGVCECAEGVDFDGAPFHFQGADCDTRRAGLRAYEQIGFLGEDAGNGTTFTAVTAPTTAKSYAFFKFEVPSVKYDLKLKVKRAAGESVAKALPTALAGYETQGVPALANYQFKSSRNFQGDEEILFVADKSTDTNGNSPSDFSDIGTMRVALLGYEDVKIDIEVSRDACAVLTCSTMGTSSAGCVNNACQCNRRLEERVFIRSYGFGGLTCATPDCPGQPDCGGSRGTCVLPAAGATGLNAYPRCECGSIFTGEACENYLIPSGMSILAAKATRPGESLANFDSGVSASGQYTRGGGSTVATTVLTVNSSFLGLTVADGSQANTAFLDPTASRFTEAQTITYYAKLTVRTAGGSTIAPDRTDPALIAKKNSIGSLEDYDSFDRSSWIGRGAVHEIVGSGGPNDYIFFSVLNGRYATSSMEFDLHVQAAADGCPEAIKDCSGHGIGECITGCRCQLGWTGVRCDQPAPTLLSGAVGTTPALAPGEWAYFLHRVLEESAEVVITAVTDAAATGPRAQPKVVALYESEITDSSVAKLNSEAGLYDYAASGNTTSTHRIVLERSSPSSQRYVVLGVQNMAKATAPLTLHVSISSGRQPSMPVCTGAPTDDPACASRNELFCSGKGEYAINNGQPFCQCTPGWDPATRCASPRFTSLNRIVSAAQDVSFLCALCQRSLSLEKDDFFLFKSPQPVQKGSTLSVTVSGVNRDGFTETEAASGARVLQTSAPASYGNPSILIAEVLPRSLGDFGEIQTTSGSEVAASLSDGSATGKYFVAVYANLAGNFSIKLQRSELTFTPVQTVPFIQQVTDWAFGTPRGNIVVALGAGMLLCLSACCCADFCAPRCCAKNLAGRDIKAENVDEAIAQQMSSYKQALQAAKSSRVLIRGSSRQIGSTQKMPSPADDDEGGGGEGGEGGARVAFGGLKRKSATQAPVAEDGGATSQGSLTPEASGVIPEPPSDDEPEREPVRKVKKVKKVKKVRRVVRKIRKPAGGDAERIVSTTHRKRGGPQAAAAMPGPAGSWAGAPPTGMMMAPAGSPTMVYMMPGAGGAPMQAAPAGMMMGFPTVHAAPGAYYGMGAQPHPAAEDIPEPDEDIPDVEEVELDEDIPEPDEDEQY